MIVGWWLLKELVNELVTLPRDLWRPHKARSRTHIYNAVGMQLHKQAVVACVRDVFLELLVVVVVVVNCSFDIVVVDFLSPSAGYNTYTCYDIKLPNGCKSLIKVNHGLSLELSKLCVFLQHCLHPAPLCTLVKNYAQKTTAEIGCGYFD